MSKRLSSKLRPACLAQLVVLAGLTSPNLAFSYHTEDDRQTDFSAFTLRKKQFRIGLFQHEYGITNAWTIGTYTLPWLAIPFTQNFNGDFYTKVKLVHYDRFALSARLTYFFLKMNSIDTGSLGTIDTSAGVLPISGTASYIVNDWWTASFDTTWVQTFASARDSESPSSELLGAGLQQTLQLTLMGELRLSQVVALNFLARYVPWARSVRFSTDADVDEQTSVVIEGQLGAQQLTHAWMIQQGSTFSWSRFNLQFGLGYGNIFVPGLRLVAASKFLIPDFDFYFRF